MFSNEEMISIAMLMTLTLAGGNVQLARMNLINVMGILAILLFMSGRSGAAVGVIVGNSKHD